MKYVVKEEGLIPMSFKSEANYLLSDKDIKLLQNDKNARLKLLASLEVDTLIVERLGSSPKGTDGVYVKFTDEFNSDIVRGDEI